MTSFQLAVIPRFRALQKQCGSYAAIRWMKNQGLSIVEALEVVKFYGIKSR